jgi:hypothetical protein
MAAPLDFKQNYNDQSYVELYIWLAKDKEGYTTTSSEGGKLAGQAYSGVARCGHVSMEMFPSNKPSVYVSLWPGKVVPALLEASLKNDEDNEGSRPDVIIRLHRLAINSMVDSFNCQKQRIEKKAISWVMDVSDSEDVTEGFTRANCASFVYSFLKVGGLFRKNSIYYQKTRSTGPKDSSFYNLMKCNAGDRWGGYFNWAPWTSWYFTPKALLLCTAAAAENVKEDMEVTTKIMNSNRVAKEKIPQESNIFATAALVVAIAGVGLALKK